ncbi:putative cytochrome P450 [Helianthus annuus]|uniref:Cytochrome P450 n=1 Tax=Helianthus annuus TaxID=4232 RepID=A0A9K3NRF6_HELAN|nr:putative cytochrome P450 [Helianthus annuus]KAJ0589083.1 putative cytochrome P450 [Helianthus annuus]KAJ0931494.1 putative cytochrome P450 [Helianthus annuus]
MFLLGRLLCNTDKKGLAVQLRRFTMLIFVDVLLDLESENKFSDGDMIAVLWEMNFRGTDTVAILLEWILPRMVLHPDIQAKAQSEIDLVTGGRPVNDSDLDNLPYLQAKRDLTYAPIGPAFVLGSSSNPRHCGGLA